MATKLLEVPDDSIPMAVRDRSRRPADLLEDRRCVFVVGLDRAEQTIAEYCGLASAGPAWPPSTPPRPAEPWLRSGSQPAFRTAV